jgi:hypothetical protein
MAKVRMALTLLAAAATIGSALAQGLPPLAEDIERRLEGAFLFTTDTGERYALYQRVEDRTGLEPGTDVICVMNRCYVQVAEVAAAKLNERGSRAGGLESVRRRFRAARDAYDALRRAPPHERAVAAAAWRTAIAALDFCLGSDEAC